MSTFVEISKGEHNHGGTGWEFGTCLWSPTANRTGADRYSLMREPRTDDRVLHFYRDTYQEKLENWIIGESRVDSPVRVVNQPPPSIGDWGEMASYYRIDLKNYSEFPQPITLETLMTQYGDEIRDDLVSNRYRFYPFNTYGPTIRTVQGVYLARCPKTLESIIDRALLLEDSSVPLIDASLTHGEYSESRRLAKERYFFARNAKLVRAAKIAQGYTCKVCGFNFYEQYGELGTEFIEAHHIDPLSERLEAEWSDALKTTIDGIIVLCANCHRMIHRRRPALTVEELKTILQRRNNAQISADGAILPR